MVGFRDAAERGDDGVVDAADADGGVAEVDEGVPGGEGGAQGDGLARADLAGDDAEGVLADAPGELGGGLGARGVAVQHAGCQVAAEGHPGEPVVGLEFVDSHWFSRARLVDGHLAGQLAGISRAGRVAEAGEADGAARQAGVVGGVDQPHVVDAGRGAGGTGC